MDRQETFDAIIELVSPFVKNKDALAAATEETRLMDDLGVNSARLVDIVLDLEDRFDIEIDDDSADRVLTLGDAIDVIHEKRG